MHVSTVFLSPEPGSKIKDGKGEWCYGKIMYRTRTKLWGINRGVNWTMSSVYHAALLANILDIGIFLLPISANSPKKIPSLLGSTYFWLAEAVICVTKLKWLLYYLWTKTCQIVTSWSTRIFLCLFISGICTLKMLVMSINDASLTQKWY